MTPEQSPTPDSDYVQMALQNAYGRARQVADSTHEVVMRLYGAEAGKCFTGLQLAMDSLATALEHHVTAPRPAPDSDYVLVSRAGLAKIASAYDDWNPDGNFASTCLAQAARAAKELLATARPTPADDAERQEGTAAKIADLKKLSSKATLGSWLHYDKVFRRQFGNGRVTEIQRYGDGKAIINWGGFDGLPDMTARKRNHNARFIVELVNFFRKHADNLLALQPRETDARMREHLRAALDHYERNICHHEETHRGGFLWTICDSCGAKWADDEGGFKPFEYPPEIVAARAALEADRGASNA